jgi:hypothetical protein
MRPVVLWVSLVGQDNSFGDEPKSGSPSSLDELSAGDNLAGAVGAVGASLHDAPTMSSATASTLPTLRRHPDLFGILSLLARLLRSFQVVSAKPERH